MDSYSEIVLVRHSKTKVLKAGQKDFDRKLRKRARKDIQLISKEFLKRKNGTKADVLCSSAVRTRQTLELLKSQGMVVPNSVLFEEGLYLASARKLENTLTSYWNQYKPHRLFLIGHNPGLTELVSYIPDLRLDHLPTSGLIFLTHPLSRDAWDWSLVKTEFVLFPKLFKL